MQQSLVDIQQSMQPLRVAVEIAQTEVNHAREVRGGHLLDIICSSNVCFCTIGLKCCDTALQTFTALNLQAVERARKTTSDAKKLEATQKAEVGSVCFQCARECSLPVNTACNQWVLILITAPGDLNCKLLLICKLCS